MKAHTSWLCRRLSAKPSITAPAIALICFFVGMALMKDTRNVKLMDS